MAALLGVVVVGVALAVVVDPLTVLAVHDAMGITERKSDAAPVGKTEYGRDARRKERGCKLTSQSFTELPITTPPSCCCASMS